MRKILRVYFKEKAQNLRVDGRSRNKNNMKIDVRQKMKQENQ